MLDNICLAVPPELPIALVDYEMPVGNTGIIFVAALEARIASWGPVFDVVATQAAYRRAGSTLAHMALVAGSTFEFLRHAAAYTVPETAAYLGVSVSTVLDWEAETTPVPTHLWYQMGDRVCEMDQRGFTPFITLPTLDLRARRIRVHPDIPRTSQVQEAPDCLC